MRPRLFRVCVLVCVCVCVWVCLPRWGVCLRLYSCLLRDRVFIWASCDEERLVQMTVMLVSSAQFEKVTECHCAMYLCA